MPTIELDLLIALVNREDRLHETASKLFEATARGKIRNLVIATSALIEYELILRSRGYSEDDIAVDIRAFTNIKNVGEAPLNSKVILAAIVLRRKYRLTYFDSLHAATATLHDGEIVSTDEAYMGVKELRAIDPEEALRNLR
ncbi:type II toxin-antitoxin system VapC family toxin [Candidatus Bathyarchaeota archaeon]|nr:type II toxin-antitoxin system VapC family toxin [Candidatus Bathyarchaeota archaeon]MBS7613879.1 type II toxin-antitoxin system VapC family toxin [Candidatus Bathyarchaeota archaeon]MBS7617382.1 type II toxin-antitoxin system VapC family toxin [Candidatus Bathyarchaeota archaeon]